LHHRDDEDDAALADAGPLARWRPLCNIAERSTQDIYSDSSACIPEFYNPDNFPVTPMTSSCSSRAPSAMTSSIENYGFGFVYDATPRNDNSVDEVTAAADRRYRTLADHVSAGAYQIRRPTTMATERHM
jgi:hypothetical protein